MRYLPLAVAGLMAMALVACNPFSDEGKVRVPSSKPLPPVPHAPSAPVVPPDPPEPEPRTSPQGMPQALIFIGPQDLTIRLSTQDNFATAVMIDNLGRRLEMRRVRSSQGVRLENEEGVAIQFENGVGAVQYASGDQVDIVQYHLP